MVATTLMGLENVLAKELRNLGADDVTELRRAVRFFGDDSILFKANLCLRTALRVLVPLDEFEARDENALYYQVLDFPWENVFGLEQTFSIDAIASGGVFTHSQFVGLKTKDAIADRFRERVGSRPSVDVKNPDIKINVKISGTTVSLSLDSSGISLDRRGYRTSSNEAPINEVLAAGIILYSGWDGSQTFIDPMSGSGTFGIEAALLATNTPPGFNRSFCFENWNDFNKNLYQQVRDDLQNSITEPKVTILCRDILPKNIDIISANVQNAGVEDYVNVKMEDFFDSSAKNDSGVLVLNPPYGERLKMDDIENFYSRIGDTLKKKYIGFDAWIISSDFSALRAVRLQPSFKVDTLNGGMDAKLQKFELYRGTRAAN